jgi:hypothetical protein
MHCDQRYRRLHGRLRCSCRASGARLALTAAVERWRNCRARRQVEGHRGEARHLSTGTRLPGAQPGRRRTDAMNARASRLQTRFASAVEVTIWGAPPRAPGISSDHRCTGACPRHRQSSSPRTCSPANKGARTTPRRAPAAGTRWPVGACDARQRPGRGDKTGRVTSKGTQARAARTVSARRLRASPRPGTRCSAR